MQKNPPKKQTLIMFRVTLSKSFFFFQLFIGFMQNLKFPVWKQVWVNVSQLIPLSSFTPIFTTYTNINIVIQTHTNSTNIYLTTIMHFNFYFFPAASTEGWRKPCCQVTVTQLSNWVGLIAKVAFWETTGPLEPQWAAGLSSLPRRKLDQRLQVSS